MTLHQSGEDYLEAIYVLLQKNGAVRSTDVAAYLGFSKPSVSHAVALLRKGGYLTVESPGYLSLTEAGRAKAAEIYEQHCFFEKTLLRAGVDPDTASKEACQMEHALSHESFQKLRQAFPQEAEVDNLG